ETRVEDHDRRAVPGAPQMQPVPSDVDEVSGRCGCRRVLSSRKPLVRGTCDGSNDDQAAQTDEDAYRPSPHVDISSMTASIKHGFARASGRTRCYTLTMRRWLVLLLFATCGASGWSSSAYKSSLASVQGPPSEVLMDFTAAGGFYSAPFPSEHRRLDD